MSVTHRTDAQHPEQERYRIRVKGHLSQQWADQFESIDIAHTEDGDTILTCAVVDQAELHSLLRKVRDTGLQLRAVQQIEEPSSDTHVKSITKEGNHMKAIVYNEYGSPDVLKLTAVATPTPKDNEVLVRVHAHSINFGDLMARNFAGVSMREFNMPSLLYIPARLGFGWRKPKVNILGSEFSGEVESVGKDVTRFKVGDAVFGYVGQNMGANAEYMTVPESGSITHKPANMSHEEASVVPYGALTAYNLLKKVNIQPGQKVLINGASGSIGAAAVQLAKHYGAEVTGVAGTPRMDFVKALGSDHVIDYTREDFTRNGETYDVILDVLGRSTFNGVKKSLKQKGIYLRASFKMRELLQMLWTSKRGGKKVICALSFDSVEDLEQVKALVEQGKIKSVIDQCFPLEHTADAHRYAESGRKQGQIVIRVA